MSLSLNLDSGMHEILEAWENKLTPNHDDYVSVDGEEGDFGVIRFFGSDVDGVANVHLMTEYVQPGDSVTKYYTPAGADVVQKMVRANIETILRKSLEASLDPGEVDDMYVGFTSDYEKAKALIETQDLHFCGKLIQGYEELFPDAICDGEVWRVGFKFYKAHVTPNGMTYFYNILNHAERLVIKCDFDSKPLRGVFCTSYASWRTAFSRYGKILSVVTDHTSSSTSPTIENI